MSTTIEATFLDRLAELEGVVPKREREVREAEVAHSRKIRELTAARGRRRSYHQEVAFGERRPSKREEARLDAAVHEIARHVEVTLDRGSQREIHLVAQAQHEATVARLDAAQGDVARFIDAHVDELLAELHALAEGSMREALDEAVTAVGRFQAEAHRIGRVGAAIAGRLNKPRRMPPTPIQVDHRIAQSFVPLPLSLLERLGLKPPTAAPPTNLVGSEL